MARKGSQHKNGVDRQPNHKKKVQTSDMKGHGKSSEAKVFPGEGHPNCEGESKQNSGKLQMNDKQERDKVHDAGESVSSGNNSRNCSSPLMETPDSRRENRMLSGSESDRKTGWAYFLNGLRINNTMKNVDFSGNLSVRNLRASALSMLKVVGEWLGRHRPLFVSLTTKIYNARDYIKLKIEQAYPVVLKWLIHFGNIMLLLSMVWLDCTLRGIDSFLRMGTTSFFALSWCSILSVIAMVGVWKFLIVLVIASFVGVFIGLTLGLLLVAISGIVFLWSYGSFWTTLLIIIIGGLSFMLHHERLALLVTTVYSVYCAWTYTGWLGLLLAFNLAFFSSDVLIYFLKNNIDQHRRSDRTTEQYPGMEGQPGSFNGEAFHASFSQSGSGLAADRSPDVPSTSGADSESTSEDEIMRLLNCADHYSVLGLSRYENVDISLLKREYRKKAMLVHPDKNMGNEKAAEAFKKLQNAYEVLIDSLKQKAYDDELRREELLNYFRRFHNNSRKNGEHIFFASGSARSDTDSGDPFGDSRHIACKRCNNFHVWVHTNRTKSRARWCQDCKEFHQAKDGDGWVEQSSQPFFFGLLQKVDAPLAYVCADSKIYNATEWYICQEMRCPANSHKPTFQVNTSIASKHNSSKGSSSGQRSGRMPTSNMEENMTEEEFFEWLQNAVQSGMFDNFSGPSDKAGNGPKSSGSSNKKKKKGKKQW